MARLRAALASAPDEGPTPEGVTWHAECNHYCARPAAPAALDVEALRAALEQAEGHQPVGIRLHDGTYDEDDQQCGVCAEDWPCLVSRLAAALVASAPDEGPTYVSVEEVNAVLDSMPGGRPPGIVVLPPPRPAAPVALDEEEVARIIHATKQSVIHHPAPLCDRCLAEAAEYAALRSEEPTDDR